MANRPGADGLGERVSAGFSLMFKPTGPLCNLSCKYCYYRDKRALYPQEQRWLMDDEVLERATEQYLSCLSQQPSVVFHWQGGEPTLCGLDFFERAVAWQQKYRRPGQQIENAFQTNGLLLDADWARLFSAHRFLVGLSIDGPPELHDAYRKDGAGEPSSKAVLASLELLLRHEVDVNVLCTVHRANAAHPAQIYDFLRRRGVRYIQLIPIVERRPDLPAGVSERSVTPQGWGSFLCGVFNRWLGGDVGRMFVPLFDAALASRVGAPSPSCVLTEYCGRALVVEHNGDLYSCDHFVTPEHRLGNLMTEPLARLVDSAAQRRFALAKSAELPTACGDCPHVHSCWGACPKDRIGESTASEPAPNYLCSGYRDFFEHATPALEAMATALREGLPAAAGVARFRAEQPQPATGTGRPTAKSKRRQRRQQRKRRRG